MDTLTREHRSWNMGRIKSKNTVPELRVRSALHGLGYRFRLHVKNLPGKPDIVLPKWKHIFFVHGCFWHRHAACKLAYTPKSRVDFWQAKFESNVERDRRARRQLEELGWKVSTIWECQTVKRDTLIDILDTLLRTSDREPGWNPPWSPSE